MHGGKEKMMKIDELLREIEEIVNTASSVPLTGKIMVEGEEIINILNEIERVLPDEIKSARWIQAEKDRILNEARTEYDAVINDAKRQAEALVEENEILTKVKKRAQEIMDVTDENVKKLKMSTFDYMDSVLYKFQEEMVELKNMYDEMFTNLESTFNKVEVMVSNNREEIKTMADKISRG